MRKEWAVDEEGGRDWRWSDLSKYPGSLLFRNKFSKHEPVRPFKMQTIVYLIWLGNKNKATLTLMNPEAEFKASRKQLAKN